MKKIRAEVTTNLPIICYPARILRKYVSRENILDSQLSQFIDFCRRGFLKQVATNLRDIQYVTYSEQRNYCCLKLPASTQPLRRGDYDKSPNQDSPNGCFRSRTSGRSTHMTSMKSTCTMTLDLIYLDNGSNQCFRRASDDTTWLEDLNFL